MGVRSGGSGKEAGDRSRRKEDRNSYKSVTPSAVPCAPSISIDVKSVISKSKRFGAANMLIGVKNHCDKAELYKGKRMG